MERIPEMLQPIVGGTDPTPRRILLGLKSKVGIITDLEKGKKSNPSSYPPRRSQPMEHQGDPPEKSPMSIDVGGRATQERCIPIPRWAGTRAVAVGTQQMDIPMVVGVQPTGERPMAACTRYLDDNLDTGAIHPSQQKMTTR